MHYKLKVTLYDLNCNICHYYLHTRKWTLIILIAIVPFKLPW